MNWWDIWNPRLRCRSAATRLHLKFRHLWCLPRQIAASAIFPKRINKRCALFIWTIFVHFLVKLSNSVIEQMLFSCQTATIYYGMVDYVFKKQRSPTKSLQILQTCEKLLLFCVDWWLLAWLWLRAWSSALFEIVYSIL